MAVVAQGRFSHFKKHPHLASQLHARLSATSPLKPAAATKPNGAAAPASRAKQSLPASPYAHLNAASPEDIAAMQAALNGGGAPAPSRATVHEFRSSKEAAAFVLAALAKAGTAGAAAQPGSTPEDAAAFILAAAAKARPNRKGS